MKPSRLILHLVNNLSETSVPKFWVDNYLNNENYTFEIHDIKNIMNYNVNKIDILHLHHIKSAAIILFHLKVIDKPKIFTMHGSYKQLSFINKILFTLITLCVNKIIFVNTHLFDELSYIQKIIINNKNHSILNGINVNNRLIKSSDIRTEYNIPDKKIVFHPARFVSEKNHKLILKGIKKLINSRNDFHLILSGDGYLKEEIINKIEQLDLKDNITLTGLIKRDKVFQIMIESEVFIMPSKSEGLNVAFLEALSFNKKIVVSAIPSFMKFYDYIGSKRLPNIIFTSSSNYEEFANNLNKSLDSVLVANKSIHKYINIEKMHEEYEKVYSSCLD